MEEIQKQIEELRKEIQSLKNTTTMPLEVENAIRDRLNIASFTPVRGSSKVASSENQAVDEGGAASYSVLKPPDGYLEVTINGLVYYIPRFDTL